MTDELFQTYQEDGTPAGVVPRRDVHRLGLWHRAANVLLYRSDGRLLLQQRSQDKDVCPGLWDLSVAEHLTPGESFIQAAHRGLKEELGLSNVQLKPLTDEIKVIYQHEQIDDREIQQTFKAETDASVTIDPSEVSAIQEISVEQLKDNLEHAPEQFTPWFRNLLKHLGWF
jgi:isopentenyl-diphosphate delta-isomerase